MFYFWKSKMNVVWFVWYRYCCYEQSNCSKSEEGDWGCFLRYTYTRRCRDFMVYIYVQLFSLNSPFLLLMIVFIIGHMYGGISVYALRAWSSFVIVIPLHDLGSRMVIRYFSSKIIIFGLLTSWIYNQFDLKTDSMNHCPASICSTYTNVWSCRRKIREDHHRFKSNQWVSFLLIIQQCCSLISARQNLI